MNAGYPELAGAGAPTFRRQKKDKNPRILSNQKRRREPENGPNRPTPPLEIGHHVDLVPPRRIIPRPARRGEGARPEGRAKVSRQGQIRASFILLL